MPKGYNKDGTPGRPPGVGVYGKDRPDEHCCDVILKNGARCRMWRAKKSAYPNRCRKHQNHGGTRYLTAPEKRLPRIYGHVLHETLKDRVDMLLDAPRSEQVELYEELALLRTAASKAVALYSAAVASGKDPLITEASAIMAESFKDIDRMATSISRIEAASKDNINVHTLNGVVAQITRLFYEVCGDTYKDLALVFEERVRTEIVLPAQDVKGTDIKPGDDVQDMDDMVPANPEDKE